MSERQELPTREDLKKLSLRGIVAYVARAARRVQPLFQRGAIGRIAQEHIDAVDRAITFAEQFALSYVANDVRAFALALAYAVAADAAESAYATYGNAGGDTAAYAARAAAYAAGGDADAAASYAARATTNAGVARVAVRDALLQDYDRLLRLTTARFPALGDPIDVIQLGPLWPDGAPEWFADSPQATVAKAHGAPSIFVAWNPELISADDYARLVETLGDLARAEGGAGITRLKSHGFGVPIGAVVPQWATNAPNLIPTSIPRSSSIYSESRPRFPRWPTRCSRRAPGRKSVEESIDT